MLQPSFVLAAYPRTMNPSFIGHRPKGLLEEAKNIGYKAFKTQLKSTEIVACLKPVNHLNLLQKIIKKMVMDLFFRK